ncbi:MAG: hypothetical protein QOH64_1793 [Acidimicrobiaceae bacterium]|jgi:hypothetical protein
MHQTDDHRRRILLRSAIAVAATIVVLVTTATTAEAKTARPAKVDLKREGANVQFTNCPASTTVEATCIGTNVGVEAREGVVGKREVESTTVFVDLFTVHIHPDGTFDVDFPPFASGASKIQLDNDGFKRITIRRTVPMSDGTQAKVAVTLTGTGPLLPFDASGPAPVPECPSGTADLTFHGRSRDATANGFAIIHGEKQQPTSAEGAPYLYAERDRGTCT